MLLLLYYMGAGGNHKTKLKGIPSSATDPKAVYYFTCCTTDYYKILEIGKKN